MFKNLKLVENWKDAWKWVSMQCMALSIAILSSWELLPPELKAMLPTEDMKMYVGPLLIIGIVGRFINQTKPKE